MKSIHAACLSSTSCSPPLPCRCTEVGILTEIPTPAAANTKLSPLPPSSSAALLCHLASLCGDAEGLRQVPHDEHGYSIRARAWNHHPDGSPWLLHLLKGGTSKPAAPPLLQTLLRRGSNWGSATNLHIPRATQDFCWSAGGHWGHRKSEHLPLTLAGFFVRWTSGNPSRRRGECCCTDIGARLPCRGTPTLCFGWLSRVRERKGWGRRPLLL